MRFFVISKWTLAVALGTFLGCSLAAAQKPDEGIAKAKAAWESNFNSKNLPGLMSLYAEDAEMLPPSEDRLVSKDKIAAYFKALFDSASTVYVKLIAIQRGILLILDTIVGRTRITSSTAGHRTAVPVLALREAFRRAVEGRERLPVAAISSY